MPEFNSLDELVEHFGYKKELYEGYLQSLSLENLERLIERPTFWKNSIQKVRALRIFKNDIEKLKILLQNIVENDIDTILNDDNIFNVIIGYIKANAEILGVFLGLLSLDKAVKVLNYLFEGGLNLNLLEFNGKNQQIIERYISNCIGENTSNSTNVDEKKLVNIFKSFYKTECVATNNWGEFILEQLIYNGQYNSFFLYFKDTIYPNEPDPDIYYGFPNFKTQEKIVEILFLLLNVAKKITGIDNEAVNQERIISMFEQLSKKQSDRLIYYLNNLILNNSYLLIEILKEPTLIRYVEPTNIISSFHSEMYNHNDTCTKVNQEMSPESLKKIFFNDSINPNLISILDSTALLKIFPFNYFIGLNDGIIDIIKEFLGRYLTYERAIIFISYLNLNDSKKKEILTDVYHVSNIGSIELEKDTIIAQAIQCILDLEEPVPDYFKAILPELISIPYDEALFEELKDIQLQIDSQEYLQVFLSQYFKHECEKKKMNYWDYHITFSPKFNTVCGSVLGSRMNIRLEDISREVSKYMGTVNHEKNHFYQYDIMPNVISIDSLMVAISIILSRDEKYYDDNYWHIYHEVHARIYGFYDTYSSLEELDSDVAKQFLMDDKNINNQNEELNNDDSVSFRNDRRKSKDITYFCNLINTFFERIPAENIADHRKKYKTLELITNEQGIPYTPEEIEGFINNFKASDLKYDATNKAIYTFYIRYLHLLTDGLNLSDGRINIYDNFSQRKKTS